MIGLSLSFCVQDIIDGRVDVNDVEKILTSTKWTLGNVQERLDDYCQNYWKSNPDLARTVFWQLWDSGRIEQPRVSDEHYAVNFPERKKRQWWIE